jgi:putative FmdB family regulatory protein
MPLYEYQCQACGRRLERIQKYSDPPLETCPDCGGKLEKLISSPAIQFKGSGWYITDYARKGESSKKGEPSNKDSGSSSSKETDNSESSDKSEKSEKKDKSDSTAKSATDSAPAAKDSSSSASSATAKKD